MHWETRINTETENLNPKWNSFFPVNVGQHFVRGGMVINPFRYGYKSEKCFSPHVPSVHSPRCSRPPKSEIDFSTLVPTHHKVPATFFV